MICLYDAEKHVYTIDDIVVPSVTAILKAKSGFSNVPMRILKPASGRGKIVHMATHYYDQNDLEESSISEETAGYLEGWKKFKKDFKVDMLSIEVPLYSVTYGFAGTPDRIASVIGRLAIIDIKTGKTEPKTIGEQMAAYEIAYKDTYGDCMMLRYGVQLTPGGTYNIWPCKSTSDHGSFLQELKYYKKEKI